MIRYALKCSNGHAFESWFASLAAFDVLDGAGQLTCPECGSADVNKALMAPGVAARDEPVPVLSEPRSDAERAIAELRRKVEENSDYVGTSFAKEARAIHAGEVPERSIYGEAKPHEARALMEEGIPLLPLPFRPKRKVQ